MAVNDPPVHVRRATSADVPALAAMLARAFLDDPVASWAWRPDRLRLGALERFHGVRLRQLLADEEVWTIDELTCAALWAPPGRWHSTLRETAELVPSFLHPRLLARMPMVGLGWEKLERAHPRTPPHVYLALLGTEPEAQGRGLGSAVLAPVLQQCDSDGVGAYLESSKERNIDFYARHGFRVLDEIQLLRGPTMWKMWRDPRP
ncbi:MAG TPA: GNAT family N-acetyltransferase [Solirubrobacteraceae bacterium]|nr:GNAT family N-acetyltransferase [Solirubrobacteraceae bacterium]